MNENDERLAKAAMKSLIVPAPESLKADLKRMARAKKTEPSLWDALREALSGDAWAYGAGAAFAAAAVAVVIVRAVPERTKPVETVAVAATTQAELADLWADDDGGDHD
ncbi:MAG: hypothetical protein HY923_06450 [Elusimicrobia bacterium]|nr:hypothetical protein [Elusimicrobiota bacterium]